MTRYVGRPRRKGLDPHLQVSSQTPHNRRIVIVEKSKDLYPTERRINLEKVKESRYETIKVLYSKYEKKRFK